MKRCNSGFHIQGSFQAFKIAQGNFKLVMWFRLDILCKIPRPILACLTQLQCWIVKCPQWSWGRVQDGQNFEEAVQRRQVSSCPCSTLDRPPRPAPPPPERVMIVKLVKTQSKFNRPPIAIEFFHCVGVCADSHHPIPSSLSLSRSLPLFSYFSSISLYSCILTISPRADQTCNCFCSPLTVSLLLPLSFSLHLSWRSVARNNEKGASGGNWYLLLCKS